MKRYCELNGGHLVQTHILDAGSFFPLNISKQKEFDRSFAPFPWSRNRFNQSLYQIQSGKKEFNLDDCSKYYFKECMAQNKYFNNYNSYDQSWIGLSNLIGGFSEYVDNKFFRDLNTKASSMYVQADDALNRLGFRISWDEKDFFSKNFNLNGAQVYGEIDIIKLGFRCMYFK